VLIGAVFFDLDDTLYPQSAWLGGAWEAVGAAAPAGVPRERLRQALGTIAAEGSDRGHIIDRALAVTGAPDGDVAPLVRAFLDHRPGRLACYPGVPEALAELRRRVPLAVVTDGNPELQLSKLVSLGLSDAFDAVVLSDELGRERRKPDAAPFLLASAELGVPARRCLHVGDRPDKDVDGARAAGLAGAVRVSTGEYAASPDDPPALARLPDVVAAVAWISRRLRVTA